ncbi:MAG: hypothetical protein H6537_10560 [Bacteroidales bacterium]|nr:hypothetical protein [Bacteroidales bacterium]
MDKQIIDMKYIKDLNKGLKKSKPALFFALLAYLIAILWIPFRLNERGSFSWFDLGYSLIIAVNGLSLTLTGLGSSIDRLFGKAFIKINSEVIIKKIGAFEKEQRIDWADIKTIDYKPTNFLITRNDNSTYKLSMTKLDYSVIQEIKNVINKIGANKNIPMNLN